VCSTLDTGCSVCCTVFSTVWKAEVFVERVAGKSVRKYTLRYYSFCFKEIEAKFVQFSTQS